MENVNSNSFSFKIDDEKIKEKLRKSKPHLIILYDQMERLDKLAEKCENIKEQIEITNSMMQILEVISNSIN
ncbi:MAG: hypothetical protein ACTTHM_02215 [Peptoanaerobacter stomatis]|uniref:hypothetical protein n=1 Tax=Peptoanaerobacter stomatis TaxID=796937 RepID=UPI003F9F7339